MVKVVSTAILSAPILQSAPALLNISFCELPLFNARANAQFKVGKFALHQPDAFNFSLQRKPGCRPRFSDKRQTWLIEEIFAAHVVHDSISLVQQLLGALPLVKRGSMLLELLCSQTRHGALCQAGFRARKLCMV